MGVCEGGRRLAAPWGQRAQERNRDLRLVRATDAPTPQPILHLPVRRPATNGQRFFALERLNSAHACQRFSPKQASSALVKASGLGSRFSGLTLPMASLARARK